ncbi:hypothetical protein EW026_g1844 [Hermanssonia centrifuga]|uniref:FAD-binding PCMH-type domain-containing protein n=1 Tax=Hermanssonia centrifuga TaxID=98765 RepID=A0A4S4KRV3_9APHY|nr:hypothetical protein EW026_g1844 [Hermanssonia centrifuga]
MSVGYEHVDLDAIAQRGIKLGYTPDVLTEAVADISVMLALMAGRNVKETMQVVNNGELSTNWMTTSRTVGFLGFGRISQATLARLVSFGFTDCVYTSNPSSQADPEADARTAEKYNLRSVRRVSLDELAEKSDVFFVLAPGGTKTHHIVNEDFLKKMKKTSVLVNTARGTLVDSDALAKALREQWIWGAGLDVVEGEPNVGLDHPLMKEPRCVILPHIGSATTETRLVYQMSVAWFFGTLLSVVATTAQDSDSTLTLLARSSQGASAGEWTNLNVTVDGRLHTAVPFELPCFSKYEGLPVTTDAAACTSIQENYTDPNFRAAHFGAYMDPQWETCQATGSGCLLDDSNPSDPLAYNGTDCEIGNIPSHYIDVQSVEDIQAAYAFSKNTGVQLSVKNTGHDYKGRSSGKGTLSLWVSHMNSISFNQTFFPERCATKYTAITIGPGAEFQDIYAFADQHNVTLIGGYHRTVGSGYFLGGGHSILSPVFGLGVDRVVVTPDGQLRVANECQNQDLFWALRGGGGNAFGVLTELTLRVEPQLTLQAAIITFPADSTNLYPWYNLTVYNSLRWGYDGWGGHISGPTLIHVTPKLNRSEAQASMQVAIDFAVAQGGFGIIDELPSWYAFFTKYVVIAEAPVGPEVMLGSRLINTTLFATEEGRTALSDAIRDVLPFSSPYIVVGTPFLYPADLVGQFSVPGQFHFNSTLEERKSVYEEVSQHIQVFRDLTPGSGAYFNEGDVYEPDHEQSYWGNNYERLLAIKRKYDPSHLMDCWQCDRYSQEENRQWAALNTTVSGRLYATVPFELPCFSTYNGHPVTTDAAACTSIQDNYTDPVFRVAHFGAYMIVSHLNSISFNPAFVPDRCSTSYTTITIGPGAEFQDVYAFADQHNVTFIGGYHRTIGSGYFLGGGHSILSPVFGLGVDRVVQLKVVTPDGQLRVANGCQNQDLFWALRGGGGSAFGVLTELSLRVEPQLTLQAAIIKFPANSSNLYPWYNLTVYNSLRWGYDGWGGHISGPSLIHVTPKLNKSEAQASMQVAIDFAVAQGGSGIIDELPSWYAFFTKYVVTAEAV